MDEKQFERPGYWTILPAVVRYDKGLTANAKLIYAEIAALAQKDGYCHASNAYFARVFDVNGRTVQRLIQQLAERGYIRVDVERDPETNEVQGRRIYAGLNPGLPPETPPDKNVVTPHDNDPTPHDKIVVTPPDKNVVKNSIDNIPPIVPPKGDKPAKAKRSKREYKQEPDWKPERFNGMWAYYPAEGRRNKQAAIRAWDTLKPEDELIDRIAFALYKLKATDEWQRGVGIPHVATFINQRRWEDADELPTPKAREEDEDEGRLPSWD